MKKKNLKISQISYMSKFKKFKFQKKNSLTEPSSEKSKNKTFFKIEDKKNSIV